MHIPQSEDTRFQLGDVIDFDIQLHENGKKAMTPVKRYNKYFSELAEAFKGNQLVSGHVYGKNNGGFLVSCNNYTCFLPFSETPFADKRENDGDSLLNTHQELKIVAIKGERLIVSRKEAIKVEEATLRQEELNELHEGLEFTGKVKCVKDFGVLIAYKHIVVLLHMKNIIDSYTADVSKEEKDRLRSILMRSFVKGRAVQVKVDRISGRNVWATWNAAQQPNATIYDELKEQGFPLKAREEESPYVIWLKSRSNEVMAPVSAESKGLRRYLPQRQVFQRLMSFFV